MAEPGSDRPASSWYRNRNRDQIANEMRDEGSRITTREAGDISNRLARRMNEIGIQGFKRGGRVHRTGVYKLHRGERVIPARSRRGRRR